MPFCWALWWAWCGPGQRRLRPGGDLGHLTGASRRVRRKAIGRATKRPWRQWNPRGARHKAASLAAMAANPTVPLSLPTRAECPATVVRQMPRRARATNGPAQDATALPRLSPCRLTDVPGLIYNVPGFHPPRPRPKRVSDRHRLRPNNEEGER